MSPHAKVLLITIALALFVVFTTLAIKARKGCLSCQAAINMVAYGSTNGGDSDQ